MDRRRKLVWIKQSALSEMISEANKRFPQETGGVLIGYQLLQTKAVVITTVVGPGPNAVHKRSSFVPDAEYQQQVIEDYYSTSGQLYTYLGDWHTHPFGDGALSLMDRATLKRIARTPAARAPNPVMAVVAKSEQDWQVNVVRLRPLRIGGIRMWYRLEVLTLRRFI